MENPIAGLQTLVDCLRLGGLIKIGPFNKLSRKYTGSFWNNTIYLNPRVIDKEMLAFRREIIIFQANDHKEILS